MPSPADVGSRVCDVRVARVATCAAVPRGRRRAETAVDCGALVIRWWNIQQMEIHGSTSPSPGRVVR